MNGIQGLSDAELGKNLVIPRILNDSRSFQPQEDNHNCAIIADKVEFATLSLLYRPL